MHGYVPYRLKDPDHENSHENADLSLWPWSALSTRSSPYFMIWTDPKLANNTIFVIYLIYVHCTCIAFMDLEKK